MSDDDIYALAIAAGFVYRDQSGEVFCAYVDGTDLRPDLLVFARALLARYGAQPVRIAVERDQELLDRQDALRAEIVALKGTIGDLEHRARQPAASAEPECSVCGGFGEVSGESPGVACQACSGTGKAAPVAAQAQPVADREKLIDAVEAAISVGPMDPIHSEDRHAWGNAWHMEPPPKPRSDHTHLQGRRACARRAVDAVLAAQASGQAQDEDERQRVGEAISQFMADNAYDNSTECCLDWADANNIDALMDVIDAARRAAGGTKCA